MLFVLDKHYLNYKCSGNKYIYIIFDFYCYRAGKMVSIRKMQ